MVNNPQPTSDTLSLDEPRWLADNTGFNKLNTAQKRQMLGANPPKLPTVATPREIMSAESPKDYPSVKDWRNVGGANYISSVKTQGLCQSCVAFSICSAVETAVKIALNQPNFEIDLSEAHLFYCSPINNPCQSGWWPTAGLDVAKNVGIAPESFFPYVAGNQVCAVGTGWESQKVQIKGWVNPKSPSEIKNWIDDKGAVIACLEIFADIHTYSKGIYHHISGESLGWHSLTVVGYNDVEGYWMCKNCWGEAFGDKGFIHIAYGECSIEQYGMFGIDGVVAARWVKSKKVLALWANDKDNNAWAFIESEGWKKIFAGNKTVFLQILMQLIQAKNKNTPINVRIYEDTIREIYS